MTYFDRKVPLEKIMKTVINELAKSHPNIKLTVLKEVPDGIKNCWGTSKQHFYAAEMTYKGCFFYWFLRRQFWKSFSRPVACASKYTTTMCICTKKFKSVTTPRAGAGTPKQCFDSIFEIIDYYIKRTEEKRERSKELKNKCEIEPFEFKPDEDRVAARWNNQGLRIDNKIVSGNVQKVVILDEFGKFHDAANADKKGDAWFLVDGCYYITYQEQGSYRLLFDGDSKFYPISGGQRVGRKFTSLYLSPDLVTESDRLFLIRVVNAYVGKGN